MRASDVYCKWKSSLIAICPQETQLCQQDEAKMTPAWTKSCELGIIFDTYNAP